MFMFADKDMRALMYGTVAVILVYIAVIIINYSQVKRKKAILATTSRMIIDKFEPLAQKNKLFKPLANETLWACLEILFVSLCQYLSFSVFAMNFGLVVHTGANFFGPVFFTPIVLVTIFIVLWSNPLKQMDFYTIAIPIVLAIDKIGCFCAGCCNGLWWPEGPYNYKTGRNEIPIQLIECACAIFIFVILLVYRKKATKRKDGDLYPIFMILYSSLRFVSEFWRGEILVLGPFRYYHLFCVIGIILGVILLAFVNKFSDSITLYFDNTLYFSRERKRKRDNKLRK